MQLPWRDVSIDGGATIRTSLTGREATTLEDLAHGHRALEIGSAFGYSAIVMARVATHVTAIDPHDRILWSLPGMEANINAYNVEDKVRIIVGRSEPVMRRLAERDVRFGLIFIDGDHSREAVKTDAKLAEQLLVDGGVLACHDYGEETCPGVAQALDELYGPPRELVDTLWIRR